MAIDFLSETNEQERERYQREDDERSASVGPWVAEWCSYGDQKGIFHVDTLRSAIVHNNEVFLGIRKAEHIAPWLILGVFRTTREASEFLNKLRDIDLTPRS